MDDNILSESKKFDINEDFESSSYKPLFSLSYVTKQECIETYIDGVTYFYKTVEFNEEVCCKIEFAYADENLNILKVPEKIDGLKVIYFSIAGKNLKNVETVVLHSFLIEMKIGSHSPHKVKTIVIPKDFKMDYLAFSYAFRHFEDSYRRYELFFDIENGNDYYVFKDRCLYSSDFKKLILFSGSHHIKEINIDERVEELLPYSLSFRRDKHSIYFKGKFKKLYDYSISSELDENYVNEVEFFGKRTLYTFYEEYDEEKAYKEGVRLYDEEWFLYQPVLRKNNFYEISKNVYFIHPDAFASFCGNSAVNKVKLDENNPYFKIINGFLVTKRSNKLVKFFSGNAPTTMKKTKSNSLKAKNAAIDLQSFTEKLLSSNDFVLERVLGLLINNSEFENDKLYVIEKLWQTIVKTIKNYEFDEYNLNYDFVGEDKFKSVRLFLYKSKSEELEKWFDFGEIELPKQGVNKRLFYKTLPLDIPHFDSEESLILFDLDKSDLDFFQSLDEGSIRIYVNRKVYALIAAAFY